MEMIWWHLAHFGLWDRWPMAEGTAEHMADYVVWNATTGLNHLDPAMPPSEQGITRDTVFDLAYWRERLGLPRNPDWDKVWTNLAPLPMEHGVYRWPVPLPARQWRIVVRRGPYVCWVGQGARSACPWVSSGELNRVVERTEGRSVNARPV